MIFVFSFTTDTASATQSQIYVSPTGNDSWDGQSAVWVNGTIGPKKTVKNATGTVAANGLVKIANGTYYENSITINRNMSIIGESKGNTIINGSNAFGIFIISGSGLTVNFANLTLSNGNSTAGGAISSNSVNTINVKNCIFQNGVARGSGGGAIYTYGQNGIPCYLTVTDSDFINNRATGGTTYAGSGGAIASFFTTLSITNSNFINNSATGVAPKGGAIHASASSGTVQFNRFIGNTATTASSIYSDTLGYVDATLNWWGSNADPSSRVTATYVSVTPWLVLTPPNDVNLSKNSKYIISADLQHDSSGNYWDTTYGHVPNGIPVIFAVPSLGTVSPLTGATLNGLLTTNFTSLSTNGIAHPTFTVDSQTVTGNVTIANVIPTRVVVDPVLGHNGDLVDIFATLTDTQNNVPLADVLIDFYVNGAYLGNALTDASGLSIMSYPITQGAGIYPIMAQFTGNDTYSASNGVNNLTVDFIPTSITSVTNPALSNYGDLIVLTANLTETIFGGALGGKNVYFSANGINLGTALTDGLGVATLSYRINITPGNYQVMAEFLGDESYSGSNATSSTLLNVDFTPTSVTVPLKSGYYNNSVSLSATLTDTLHNLPVTGRIVNFFVNGTLVGNATTSGGIATLSYLIPFMPGTYSVFAAFAGDSGYLASNGTNNLLVNNTPTNIINVVARSGYYGDVVNLTATLRNSLTIVSLSNKTINFFVNGTLVGNAITNAAGTATLPYNINQGVGSYLILAQFAGDTLYNASSANNTLTVNIIPTNITVASKSGYYGDIVNLTATLKDNIHNITLGGKNITFNVNGSVVGSALTDGSGIATLPYNITQGAGIYTIFAQFAGDTIYQAKNSTNNLTVNYIPTNLSVNPLNGYYGDLVNLTATLTDNVHSVPVVGRNVSFSVNGSVVGSALTDASGMAMLGYNVALTAGSYQILAQFAGDTIYSASNANNNLMVSQTPTGLVVSPISSYYGDLTNLTATLTDLHNNLPVVGRNVSFSVNGSVVGSALTDASGIATLNSITLTPGMILAQFAGDTIYAGSSGTTTPTINLIPTQITAGAVNASTGALVNLTANLMDTAHNVPVVGRNVSFSVDGSVVGSALTDASGIAVLPYNVTQVGGIYQILAQFAGDTLYASNSNLNNLNVTRTSTNLLVNPVSGYSGTIVNLTANLTNSVNNAPVVGRNVTFRVNGVSVGSVLTDALGVATLQYTAQGVGNYTILAQFIGDAAYVGSNGTNNLTVMVNNPPIVTAIDPVNNAVNVALNKVIKVTFNQAVLMGSNWIELVNTKTGALVPVSTSISGNVLSITPNSALANGIVYQVLLHTGSVTSLGGSPVGAYVSKFTTVGPLAITSIDPVNNAVNVALNKVIKVTFNQAVLMGSNWIELVNTKTGALVPVSTSISGNVLSITPNSVLANGVAYQVLLHTGSVTDLAGNPVGAYVSKFTTVPPLAISSVDPVNNAVNVPTNKVIKVTFNQAVLMGSNWIELVNTKTGALVPVSTSISGNVFSITPNSVLAKGIVYQLLLHTGYVTNLAGNPAASYVGKFTTKP